MMHRLLPYLLCALTVVVLLNVYLAVRVMPPGGSGTASPDANGRSILWWWATRSTRQHPLSLSILPSSSSNWLLARHDEQQHRKVERRKTRKAYDGATAAQHPRGPGRWRADTTLRWPANDTDAYHRLAGLDCARYGGPDHETAQRLVYWRDIARDAPFVSPFYDATQERYLTFELDEGGFNNIRLALETCIVLALATGRTLVIPPAQKMYLLFNKDVKNTMDMSDFYHLASLAREMPGFKVITFKTFLERVVLTGQLRDPAGRPSFPPHNQTNWNGLLINFMSARQGHGATLWQWLRNVTTSLESWNPGECVAAIPRDDRHASIVMLEQALRNVLAQDEAQHNNRTKIKKGMRRIFRHDNNPAPVHGNVTTRLAEALAQRDQLCIYDATLQRARVVHVRGEHKKDGNTRMLVPFYAFLFFQDWRVDLLMKRFVRDHLRYVDEIQCAAGRVLAALRAKIRGAVTASSNNNSTTTTTFDSMHIRRGDFQFERTRLRADQYLLNVQHVIPPTEPRRAIYVATDERNRTFFDPLASHYDVYYLSNFSHVLDYVNPNYYGMIDQIVAAQGDCFLGTYYSTFTSYIMRLRGYLLHGNDSDGKLLKTYYFGPVHMPHVRTAMRRYMAVRAPLWAREFPVAWRDIDHDV